MPLRNVNLNLLPLLQALLQTRSVSKTAERLTMSQPAASDGLKRLRATLGDPLLVRVGARMEISPLAEALIAPLEDICQRLDHFFSLPTFDPALALRAFVIATADYGTHLVGPPLMAMLRTAAPGISVRFADLNAHLADDLARREVDLAIVPSFFIEDLAPAPLRFRPLFRDVGAVLLDAAHPLCAKGPLSRDDLLPYRMVSAHPGSAAIERKRIGAFMGGETFPTSVFVPQLMQIPYLVADSLDFGFVPAKLAKEMVLGGRLVLKKLAFPSQDIEMGLVWSPVQDSDAAHRWLRDILIRLTAPT